MFPLGETTFQVFVVGEGDEVSNSLAHSSIDTDDSLEIEARDTEVVDGALAATAVDCVVLDGAAFEDGGVDAVASVRDAASGVPVVLLVADDDPGRVRDALAVGATETLPRAVATEHEEIFADRVARVTERAHADSAVEDIYDGIPGPVSVHDADTGRMVHANRSLCELLGYDRDELLSKRIDDLTLEVPGQDHTRAMQLVASVADRDSPLEVEWPLKTVDGAVRWLEAELSPVTVGGREFVLSAATEVTERRRREREYEAVFDGVNDVITVHDPWGEELLDVNETLCDLTGYGRDALCSMGIDGFSATDQGFTADRAYEVQQRVAATGDAESLDWLVETASGDRRRLECVLSPATIAGEERVLVLARDVTERRQLEESYRDLFENVSDGLVVHDPESGEIMDANEQYCRLTGYNRDELVGSNVRLVLPEESDYTDEALERIRAAREEGSQLFELEGERKDGQRFPAEIHLSVVEIRGEERVLASVRDITERKRREREYEQIFNGVNDSVVVQDPETAQPVDANQTFLDRLGYDSVGEIREAGFEALSATDAGYTLARARQICQRVIETGNAETVEWQQETRSGDRRWIEATVDAAEIGGEDRIISIQRDVTERRRRERMVRALHEATDDLQEAETPEAVCEAAVDAAMEVLDLRAPTCWLQGVDGEDALTPVASSDTVQDLPAEDRPRVLEPGDHEYDVFEAGERHIGDPDALNGGPAPGDAVLVPLGDHGLFGAVERGDEFDDVTLDTVGILGRHVESALDRVERARELRESERRFRLIANHIDEIVYLATADFSEIRYINDAYEGIYGRPVEELSDDPKSFVEAAHPKDRDDYKADIQRLISDIEAGDPQDAYEGEYRIRRDAETRWVAVTRFPVENDAGDIDRIVGRVQDITERKRREREYEQIFNGVNDSITVHDPETAELLDVNEAFCDLLGYDREEILEMGIEGFTPDDQGFSLEDARAFVREVVEAGEPRQTEWAVATRDDETRWLDVKGTIVEFGGEQRYVSIDRDITERRRTERRLKAILDRIDEAIFLTRAHAITETSQEPDYVSAGYEDIYGLTLEEIQEEYDEGFFGTLHPDDEPTHRSFVESIVADIDDGDADDRYTTEYRIQRQDGGVRWVQADYYPVEWRGEQPRIVIVSRDITDRKEREQRLASFEDATDDLTTADSRKEAAQSAVKAATDALGLPAVGVLLYNRDDGVLEPEAASPDLPAALGEHNVGPSGGPLWTAFAAGDVVGTDTNANGDHPLAVGDDLVDWRGIPLGNHGVLFVGSTDAALDPNAVQSAHVLAATLEAALNHLRGERQIASREEELRTAAERADRLDRIARLTHQVEAAITEASAESDIERAVCRQLVDANPYEVAWIGNVEVGTDRIAPSTVVGESDRYVDAMGLTTTDDADPHPAVEAWQADANAVESSIVGSGPADDWRQHVLSYGYQSVCAVPLTYNGVTHGVLSVAADAPSAFGQRTREVLEQLGTSIGHALAGIERRRALESDETVELEFRGDGHGLSFAEFAADVGCRVHHERTVRHGDDDVSVYFAIDEEPPENAVERARQLLSGQVTVVRDEADAILVEVRTDTWFGSPLAEYGAVLRRAAATPAETTLVVELPSRSDVRSFAERVNDLAPSLELEARRQHQHAQRTAEELRNRIEADLTDRQHETLRMAFDEGYFEWPRESDGSEVADRLDITQPTFNKHLRLAEQKTFAALFGEQT